MDVQLSSGSVLRNIRSAARTTVYQFGSPVQAIRLRSGSGGNNIGDNGCRDTILSAEAVTAFLHEGIGGTQSPLKYPVAPAREIRRSNGVSVARSFAEILGNVGFAGADTSGRAIGFGDFYGGIEAVVAPFGDILGEYLSIGIGGGLMDEGSRLRFPLYGELRFTWPGSDRVDFVTRYYPDSCQFGIPGDADVAAPWSNYEEVPKSRTDKTVYFTRDREVVHASFRPYVYLDGGTVFDSKFDGAGTPANAVNPDFRKPLLLGAGIGHPIGDHWTIAIGYRYMQLHLATPCPQCVDRTIINRNTVHSITLRGGWRIGW
jgi:hypothetical protein